MPWKVSDPMSERLKFISRYLEGEKMTDLCDEFTTPRATSLLKVSFVPEHPTSADGARRDLQPYSSFNRAAQKSWLPLHPAIAPFVPAASPQSAMLPIVSMPAGQLGLLV